MLRPLRIAITSGDAAGIGPEVVAKALAKGRPQKNIQFILWRNHEFPKRDLLRIKKVFKLVTVSSWAEALSRMPSTPKELLDICTTTNPAIWVEEAATACFFKHLDAMATAPLSKPAIKESGLKDIGHTDILKRISHTKQAYMVFLGKKFNVMLATGHLPIRDVSSHLTFESIADAVRSAHGLVKLLGKISNKDSFKKPIGILGLNPHAGDSGLIGDEDNEILRPVLERLSLDKISSDKILYEGPLVPDSAFTPNQWSRYSLYLALYHDQGLIPFKTVHGQEGVHLTWGLPFIRTSVDHGTAFDIAGKDRADATSMRLAVQLAIRLAQASAKME